MNFLRLNIFDFNKRMNEWIRVYQKEHEYIHWYWYLYIFIWTLFLLFTQIQTETEQQESANNFVIYLYVCVCLFIATGHGWVPCWRRCGWMFQEPSLLAHILWVCVGIADNTLCSKLNFNMKPLGYQDSHEGCYHTMQNCVHLELRWGINKSTFILCLFARDIDRRATGHIGTHYFSCSLAFSLFLFLPYSLPLAVY